MQQAEITPTLFGIGRPNCPRCGARMMLARVGTILGRPDHDARTFECIQCRQELSKVVRFK